MYKKITKKEENKLKLHARRLSIKDGIFYSARSSFGDQYISPFAIMIGSSNSLVAIINSIFNIGLISQLFGGKLVGKYSRKSILTKSLLGESLGWLIILLSAIFYLKGMFVVELPYIVIFALSIALLSVGIGHPAWFSWIGDVVDDKFRGRWFSKRTTVISFSIIIFVSTIWVIKRQYEPKIKKGKKSKYKLKDFIKEFNKTNFGKFVAFRTALGFVVGITSSLYSIYLLRNLGFDYVSYMVIMLSGTFFSIITLNMWGKISDKYGSYRVIAISTLLAPLTPLLWTLSTSKIYLFFVPALLGGVSWGGFIMASGTFIYDNVEKEKRASAISYFNLFVGVSAILGGFLSAYLLKIINFSFASPIIILFITGAILRMIVIGLWVPKLYEITKKRKFENITELKNIILKDIKPTLVEDMNEIIEIKSYIEE